MHKVQAGQVDYVDRTIGQLTIQTFQKIKQWIMKSRQSKCSFALSTLKSEINLNDQDAFHKPA